MPNENYNTTADSTQAKEISAKFLPPLEGEDLAQEYRKNYYVCRISKLEVGIMLLLKFFRVEGSQKRNFNRVRFFG